MHLYLKVIFRTDKVNNIMKINVFLKLVWVVVFTFLFSPYVLASDNISGIWSGTVNSNWTGPDANAKDKIYLSIHQTTDNVVIVFLSSVEETQDLFSSTYHGKDLNQLESYGVNAYFPEYNPTDKSLTYLNIPWPLKIEIHEGGQSGLVHRLCDACSFNSVLVIKKVL